MEDNEIYAKAEKRVEAKLDFYKHLAGYIVVNLLLIVINLLTSPEYYWFKWPLMFWGIAIVIHALQVFAFPKEASLKARMIEKEIKKTSRTEE
jgi:hypothetical protein